MDWVDRMKYSADVFQLLKRINLSRGDCILPTDHFLVPGHYRSLVGVLYSGRAGKGRTASDIDTSRKIESN